MADQEDAFDQLENISEEFPRVEEGSAFSVNQSDITHENSLVHLPEVFSPTTFQSSSLLPSPPIIPFVADTIDVPQADFPLQLTNLYSQPGADQAVIYYPAWSVPLFYGTPDGDQATMLYYPAWPAFQFGPGGYQAVIVYYPQWQVALHFEVEPPPPGTELPGVVYYPAFYYGPVPSFFYGPVPSFFYGPPPPVMVMLPPPSQPEPLPPGT